MLDLVRDFTRYLEVLRDLDTKRLIQFFDCEKHPDFSDQQSFSAFIEQADRMSCLISHAMEAHGLDSTGYEVCNKSMAWRSVLDGSLTDDQRRAFDEKIEEAKSILSRLEKKLAVQVVCHSTKSSPVSSRGTEMGNNRKQVEQDAFVFPTEGVWTTPITLETIAAALRCSYVTVKNTYKNYLRKISRQRWIFRIDNPLLAEDEQSEVQKQLPIIKKS